MINSIVHLSSGEDLYVTETLEEIEEMFLDTFLAYVILTKDISDEKVTYFVPFNKIEYIKSQ